MDQSETWRAVLSAAGAAGALVGIVYAVGSVVLSFRYVGFGLSGQRVTGLISRDYAFFSGARSLLIWGAIGACVVYLLHGAADSIRPATRRFGGAALIAAGAVALVALVTLLHVWWPLAAAGGLLAMTAAELTPRGGSWARAAVAVIAIAGVAITYEADRLHFTADRVYVDVANTVNTAGITRPGPTRRDIVACVQHPHRLCGVLVAHDGLGQHLAVASSAKPASGTPSERLVKQLEWMKIMARRRRKTLVVCGACHANIHDRQPTASNTE